jgi:hypothetical protein
LQSLDAPLQALCPLHEFPPTHLTCAVVDVELSAARAVLPMKASATAVAIIAPVIFAFVMTLSPLESRSGSDIYRLTNRAPKLLQLYTTV